MKVFDITPIGAFMNAMDAAAEKDRQIARKKAAQGERQRPAPPQTSHTMSSAVLMVLEAIADSYEAALLRLAPRRPR